MGALYTKTQAARHDEIFLPLGTWESNQGRLARPVKKSTPSRPVTYQSQFLVLWRST